MEASIMFNIGDRVEAIRKIREIEICSGISIDEGDQGVVCAPPDLYDCWGGIGVRWDKYVGGHDCYGYCTPGHGWVVEEEYLEPCYDTDAPFEFSEEDFMNLILAKSAATNC